MARTSWFAASLVSSLALMTLAGCGKTPETRSPAQQKMVDLITEEAKLYKSSGKDICMKIAKRLNIYVDNDLYEDSGFEQTYQTFLDIGVQQGCTGNGQTTQAAATPAPARVATHIKAGGYVCDSAFQVMGERQLRGNAPVAFRGCAQIGADTEVNMLGRDSNYDAIEVGNTGGVAWVDSQDLVQ